MTVLRKDPDAISNYFDRLIAGIGHRGSSFTDVDALTHDGRTDRFLFQEFKEENEPWSPGQQRTLEALSRRDGITCWYVQRRRDGTLVWYEFYKGVIETWGPITTDEYRQRFADWWANRRDLAPHDDARFPPDPSEEANRS